MEVVGSLYGAHLLGRFLDAAVAMTGGVHASVLWGLSAAIAGVSAVVMVVQYQSSWLLGSLTSRTTAEVRAALFARLHLRPMSFHLGNESAALAHLLR